MELQQYLELIFVKGWERDNKKTKPPMDDISEVAETMAQVMKDLRLTIVETNLLKGEQDV